MADIHCHFYLKGTPHLSRFASIQTLSQPVMKHLTILLMLIVGPLLYLNGQTEDPELAGKLKAVMAMFDKNQETLKQEMAELSESNIALIKANLALYQDLQSAEKTIESLESENALLRKKLSEIAVSELESASLQTTRSPSSLGTTASDEALPTSATSTSPIPSDGTTAETLLNINTASLEELDALPTIDEVMAEQIISNRPYKTLEDLIINQGFGPMKLRRISPFVTVE